MVHTRTAPSFVFVFPASLVPPPATQKRLSLLCMRGKLPLQPWVFPPFPGLWYKVHARVLQPFLLTDLGFLMLKQHCNTTSPALTVAGLGFPRTQGQNSSQVLARCPEAIGFSLMVWF